MEVCSIFQSASSAMLRRRRTVVRHLAIFLLFAAAAFAQPPADRLTGSSWRLVRFEGSGGRTITPADPSKYTIAFGKDGDVSARVDCNRGHGTWTSSGASQLTFGPLALTRAMCGPALLNDRLPTDLPAVGSYAIRNGHLFLTLLADAGVYEFEPMAQSAAPLENTDWTLTKIGDVAVTPPSSAQTAHIVLNKANHRVSGSGGCNRITGGYQLSGDRLRFTRIAATLMACVDGMETEKAFLHALEQVRTWKIAGQQLELDDAAGHRVARLEAP
jgi:heat shock protein HslJ